MKKADLIVAGIMAVFSVYLMAKSAELPIGWVSGEGPGGGAFSFWLSTLMLICSVVVIVQNVMRVSTEGSSKSIFMDPSSIKLFASAFISLSLMLAAIHVIGIYFAIPLFLLYHTRYIGKHSWLLSLSIALITPVAVFLLFEKLLLILLPKGLTDEWFYIFY